MREKPRGGSRRLCFLCFYSYVARRAGAVPDLGRVMRAAARTGDEGACGGGAVAPGAACHGRVHASHRPGGGRAWPREPAPAKPRASARSRRVRRSPSRRRRATPRRRARRPRPSASGAGEGARSSRGVGAAPHMPGASSVVPGPPRPCTRPGRRGPDAPRGGHGGPRVPRRRGGRSGLRGRCGVAVPTRPPTGGGPRRRVSAARARDAAAHTPARGPHARRC